MNQTNRRFLALALILAQASVPLLARADNSYSAEVNWAPLFNGRDLDDWTVKITGQASGEDQRNTFRVEDGLLKVRYDEYESFAGQFGHLFHNTALSHYALHIEYRFVGEQAKGGPAGWAVRNSGVMLHAQDAASMTLKQDFPVSIEAQFLGGLSNEQARPTANVCTPGTDITVDRQVYPHHCLASTADTFDGDQWVNITVVVLGGGSITHYVEGEKVLSYHNPELDSATAHAKTEQNSSSLTQGFIALQSESHPIDFRQVRVLNLSGCTDPNAANHQAYYLKSDPDSCEY